MKVFVPWQRLEEWAAFSSSPKELPPPGQRAACHSFHSQLLHPSSHTLFKEVILLSTDWKATGSSKLYNTKKIPLPYIEMLNRLMTVDIAINDLVTLTKATLFFFSKELNTDV